MGEMTPQENLHYAIGELAYAIARADGKVQREERDKFHAMVMEELQQHHQAFDIAEIIFEVMDRDQPSAKTAYEWAIREIRTNSHYLSPELKETFVKVMEKVAEAYPPVTIDEKLLIDRFREDIAPLHGDPVYYADPR